MTEVWVIRGFVGIYLVFAMFAGFILWLNAGASDAAGNAVVAVASVMALLAAVSTYLVPEPQKERIQAALFYDQVGKGFVVGFGSYMTAYGGGAVAAQHTKAESLDAAFKSGLDIVEKAVVAELSHRFANTWDMEFASFRTPGGGRSRIGSGSSENPGPVLSPEMLGATFAHNAYAKGIAPWPLMLPPESEMSVEVGDKVRRIAIENPSFMLSIRVAQSGGYVIQHGVPGVIPRPKEVEKHPPYALIYNIETEFRPSRWRGHSPLMPSYRRWYDNVREAMRTFDWTRIEAEIEREEGRSQAMQPGP